MKTMAILTAFMACIVSIGAQAELSQRLTVLKTYHSGMSEVREVCIDGIVYLIFEGYYKAGITVKINADHYPYTCNN